jgi:hypothetical protein
VEVREEGEEEELREEKSEYMGPIRKKRRGRTRICKW